jgi:hypothetical protein
MDMNPIDDPTDFYDGVPLLPPATEAALAAQRRFWRAVRSGGAVDEVELREWLRGWEGW